MTILRHVGCRCNFAEDNYHWLASTWAELRRFPGYRRRRLPTTVVEILGDSDDSRFAGEPRLFSETMALTFHCHL